VRLVFHFGEGEAFEGADLVVGEALEQEFFDVAPSAAGILDLVEGLGVRRAEFGGQLDAVGDAFLFAEVSDVSMHVLEAHCQIAGDAAEGPAVEQAAQDGLAARGGAVELAAASAFAAWLVPLGFGDFVAVEQAAGEGGDDEIPALAARAGGALNFVAFCAGEGWRRGDDGVCVVAEEFGGSTADTAAVHSGIGAEEIKEGTGRQRTIDGSAGLFAGWAEPTVADQLRVVFAPEIETTESGPSHNRLLEVIGEHVSKPLPQ